MAILRNNRSVKNLKE